MDGRAISWGSVHTLMHFVANTCLCVYYVNIFFSAWLYDKTNSYPGSMFLESVFLFVPYCHALPIPIFFTFCFHFSYILPFRKEWHSRQDDWRDLLFYSILFLSTTKKTRFLLFSLIQKPSYHHIQDLQFDIGFVWRMAWK